MNAIKFPCRVSNKFIILGNMVQHIVTLSYLLLLQRVWGFEKLDINLLSKLQSAAADSIWRVIILLKRHDIEALKEKVEGLTGPAKSAMIRHVLMEKSNSTQFMLLQSIRNYKPKPLRVQSFWIVNAIGLEATKGLVLRLSRDSLKEYKDIVHIMEDKEFSGDPVEITETISTKVIPPGAWGLQMINAPAWWEAGYDGRNVIIGILDDGVDAEHPNLHPSWLGEHGWKDGYYGFPVPYFHGPHGTMMLGHIVGYTIGVARGAKWSACSNNIGPNLKSIWATLDCFIFFLCPNPRSNCTLKPTILNFSIGASYVNLAALQRDMYDFIVEVLTINEQMPVISVGNDGATGCGSINHPSDHEYAIGVGNVGRDAEVPGGLVLHATSGKGPASRSGPVDLDGRFLGGEFYKPDIVAPGTDVYTTTTVPRNGFATITGASSAGAHVSGAIALLLSRNRDLNYEQVRTILYNNARRGGLRSHTQTELCGGIPDATIPNYKFGWGSLWLPDPEAMELGRPLPPKPLVYPPSG